MIKNIVFDFGGVIVDIDRDKAVQAFIKLGLADADTRLDKYHQTGIFQELEEGKLSADEFRKQLGNLCGRSLTMEETKQAWLGFFNEVDLRKLDYMLELRASGNDIVAPYAEKYPNSTFVAGRRPWEVKVDIALPCATQNELNGEDACNLIKNSVLCIGEISNMGCTPEAIDAFIENKLMYAPGKAVNAGGVATSGLEMSQNAMHMSWSAQEVDDKLHQIMYGIHEQCVKYGTEPDGYINYVKGANIAGFMKVAHAMMGQGVI